MKKKLMAIALGLIIVLSGGIALAGMNAGTATYQVGIVGGGGSIGIGGGGSNYGSYALGTSDLTGVAAGSISVACDDPLTGYKWGMNAGMNWNMGAYPGNAMSDGNGHYISYGIQNPWAASPPVPPFTNAYLGDNGLNAVDPNYSETNAQECASDSGGFFYGARTFDLLTDIGISTAPTSGSYTDTVIFTVVYE